ncbi:hypothetical protein RCL1_007720 [Eukaryota sp. TZLM3-RCL]
MVSRYLELRKTVERTLVGDEDEEILRIADYSKTEYLCQLLKRFYDTTVKLSERKQTTCSEYMLLMDELGAILATRGQELEMDGFEDEQLQSMINTMMERMYEFSDHTYDFFNKITTVLDPRIKLQLSPLTESEKRVFESRFATMFEGLAMNLNEAATEECRTRTSGLLGGILRKRLGENAVSVMRSTNELSMYTSEPVIHDESDVLLYWANQEQRYPKLCAVAKDYMSVQPTSIPCEQLFSLASNVITKKKSIAG